MRRQGTQRVSERRTSAVRNGDTTNAVMTTSDALRVDDGQLGGLEECERETHSFVWLRASSTLSQSCSIWATAVGETSGHASAARSSATFVALSALPRYTPALMPKHVPTCG